MSETSAIELARIPASYQELFAMQEELNAICGRPSRSADGTWAGFEPDLFFDYQMALVAELAELMDMVLWKHWTKEARDGRRWEFYDPSGPGSGLQNARVELIDVLFFMASMDLVAGVSAELFSSRLEASAELVSAAAVLTTDAQAPVGKVVVERLMRLTFNARLIGDRSLEDWGHFMTLCVVLGLTQADVLRLYGLKHKVNVDRQHRNVAQMNDPERARENAGVV